MNYDQMFALVVYMMIFNGNFGSFDLFLVSYVIYSAIESCDIDIGSSTLLFMALMIVISIIFFMPQIIKLWNVKQDPPKKIKKIKPRIFCSKYPITKDIYILNSDIEILKKSNISDEEIKKISIACCLPENMIRNFNEKLKTFDKINKIRMYYTDNGKTRDYYMDVNGKQFDDKKNDVVVINDDDIVNESVKDNNVENNENIVNNNIDNNNIEENNNENNNDDI